MHCRYRTGRHKALIVRVHDFSAEAVCEEGSEIDAFPVETGAEATEYRRKRRTLENTSGMGGIIRIRHSVDFHVCSLVLGILYSLVPFGIVRNHLVSVFRIIRHEIGAVAMHPEERTTVDLVYAGIIIYVMLIDASALETRCIGKILSVGEADNLVLHESEVDVEVPCEFTVADDVHAEVELPSGVAHRTDVADDVRVAAETGGSGDKTSGSGKCIFVDKVAVVLIEVSDAEIESVVEERTFESDIHRTGSLPAEIGVSERHSHESLRPGRVKVGIIDIVCSEVVTYSTVRCAEFEEVDPIGILKEFLLRQDPASADAPECTPALVLCKA